MATTTTPVPSIRDTVTGWSITCNTSTISITWGAVTGHPNSVGSVTNWTFGDSSTPGSSCGGPAGLVVHITLSGFPYDLIGTSYTAGTGTSTGTVPGIWINLTASDGCQATIGGPSGGPGSSNWKYVNSTGQLTFSGGTLVVQTATSACDPALINVGDGIVINASYKPSPKVTITSP